MLPELGWAGRWYRLNLPNIFSEKVLINIYLDFKTFQQNFYHFDFNNMFDILNTIYINIVILQVQKYHLFLKIFFFSDLLMSSACNISQIHRK